MKTEIKLKAPAMPNFIAFDRPPQPRQNGIQQVGIRVGELTREQAEQYAELMKQEFMKHWEAQVITHNP